MKVVAALLVLWMVGAAVTNLFAPKWVYSIRKTMNRAHGIVMDEEPRDVTIALIRFGGCLLFLVALFLLVVLLTRT